MVDLNAKISKACRNIDRTVNSFWIKAYGKIVNR